MGELKSNEILNKTIKELRDYEPIIAEDDCLGRWRQNIIEWLLKPLDIDIKVRDKDDEVWKDKVVKRQNSGL